MKLFHSATIITVNPDREIIRNGYILVNRSRIEAIGKCPVPADFTIDRSIDCTGKIIIPGLINTHAHLVQSLLRGLAEDLPLHEWLCDAIWPLESVYEELDGYHAARLTMAEMLKTGTTCFLDPMLTYQAGFENGLQRYSDGNRLIKQGKLVKFPETNRQLSISDPRDRDLISMSIPALIDRHREFHGQHDQRLHVWAAAGTPRGAPMSLFQELGDACVTNGISLTMHCAEAPRDLEIYRGTYHCTRDPEKRSHNLVLAHMVNLDCDIDLLLLASTRTSVAHNPSSNLKLASGIAPVPAMLSEPYNINVSLGTDGAPCSNHYDMIQEMHLAATLHKGVHHDARLIPAETALEMATINGARALGLEDEIGSLEVGKKADFVVLDPYGRGGLGAAPWHWEDGDGVTAVTTVVHGCTGRDVNMTVVDGEILVEDGVLVHGGLEREREIVTKAQKAIKGIRGRCNADREEELSIKGQLRKGWRYST
ncbi:amidohydrolase [Aspergillus thermomutatus]|uniref:Amidohydrolase-related domain-containing protein n=1 Tax=Aspergillus thermomutatus TaxID=41047 RepID=A0A397HL79_ASPTH|nr:uncharacterized protein CDV56_104758 [Aspergillus thermomutatus]RHZ61993.1 hypothetical protein CDV56_104758 [Aspergillus thermomutatus]